MLNANEGQIIGEFMKNLDDYENEEMTLKWQDGSEVVAEFYTCFEDANDFELDDDDENFEEYMSFAFFLIKILGNPPIEISQSNSFLLNYHNFPNEIIVNGKKIN